MPGLFDDVLQPQARKGGLFDDVLADAPLGDAAPQEDGGILDIIAAPFRGLARSGAGDAITRGATSALASGLHSASDFIDQTVQGPLRGILQPLGLMPDADPLGAAAAANESLGVEREINADRVAAQQRIGGRPTLADLSANPAAAVEQYAAHIGNMGAESLPLMAAAIATRNPELAAGLIGAGTGAQEYTDLRTQGADRLPAAVAGLGTGAIETAGEAIGLPFVMGRGNKSSLLRAILAEGGQEVPVQLGQQALDDLATGHETPIPQQLGDALDAFIVGGGMGAGGHGLSVATDALAAREAARSEAPPTNAIDPAILAAGNAGLGDVIPPQAAPVVQPEDTSDLDALITANLPPDVLQAARDATPDQQAAALATLADLTGEPADPDAAFRRPDPAPAVTTPASPAIEPRASLPAQDFVSELAARMRVSAQEQAARTAAPAAQSPAAPVGSRPAGGDLADAPRVQPVTPQDSAAPAASAGKLFQRGNGRNNSSAQALQTPDGRWFVRHRKAGQWQAWEPRDRFDPSPAFGYRETGMTGGAVNLPGVGKVPVAKSERETRTPDFNPLLDLIAGAGGISRADARRFGVDPETMKQRRGIRPLFSDKGLPLDRLREVLLEEGYLPPEPTDAPPRIDLNDVWDLVDRALSGRPVAAMDDPRMAEFMAQRERDRYGPEDTDADFDPDEELARWFDEASPDDPIRPGDEEEAASIAELASRAAQAGADDFDLARFTGETDAAYAARLWRAIQQEQAHGPDREAEGSRVREVVRGREGGQGEPVPQGTRPDSTPAAERAQEVAPSAGLFGAPTPRDFIDDAQRRKDAARDGKTGTGRTDMLAGDGELFAGDRPEQARVDALESEDAQELTTDDLTDSERAAFARQSVDRSALRARASQQNGERDADANNLRDAVTKAVGGASVQVEYLRGMDGLPDRTRRLLADRARQRGTAQRTSGLYVPGKPPRVFLFTDVVTTPETAAFTAAHEIAGHHGLRALLGDGLNHALEIALQNPTVAAVADSMAKRRKSSDRLLMAEEALADLAAVARTGNYAEIEARHGVKVPLAMRSRLVAAIDNFIRRVKALFGKRGVAFTDAQVRELLENAWQAAKGEGATAGDAAEQVVFHGTPHTVDRFSLQKIGTGEGAQAYGWGMYFASEKEIAKHYQRALAQRDASGENIGQLDGVAFGELSAEERRAIRIFRDWKGDAAGAVASDVGKANPEAASILRAVANGERRITLNTGNLYQAEVPEDSDLLDWDKPLSEQPEKVRAALAGLGYDLSMTGQEVYRALANGVGPDARIAAITDTGRRNAAGLSVHEYSARGASEFLNAAGIPGLRYLDGSSRNKGEGSHNYVIWDEAAIGEPQGLLESVEDARDTAEARREEAAGTLPVARGAAGWAYDGSKWVGRKGRASEARANLQDKMLAWRDAQGQIESQLQAAIPDAQNVYRLENLMHGRVGEGIDRIEREQVKPLMEAMRAAGVKPETLEEYLYARHAGERNAAIAKINPAMPDGGSGMTNAEAARILAGADKATLEPLARKVDGIAAATRRRLLANGLITQEAFDAMEAQYEHYVPLRGKAVAEDADFGGTGMAGRGLDSRGKMVREALGRGAGNRASDILAEIIGDAERSVILAEKARVGRAVMRIVLANQNPDLWMVEPVQTERALDANGEVYEKVVNDWSDPSVVAVRHKGQLYKVQINSVPLAKALNHVGVDKLSGITRAAGAVNRYFSAILTKYNPAFTPVNATRDALFGLTGLAAEHGELAALDAALHYPQAAAAAFQQARGKQLPGEWGEWADEFAANGGKTGYVNMPSTEDIARKIGSGKLTGYSPDGMRKAARAIGEAVGTINDAVENALRLSAYVTLRKRGQSAEAAAAYAKDLTVNFNRKGFDGSAWNAWFLFYNASLQGAHRTSRLLRKPKTYAYLGMLAGAQVLATMAAMGMKDDNDDPLWNKVPDHVKRRNIVIVTGDGGLITIPMPYGFNLLPYVAGRITEATLNGQRGEKRAGDRAAQLAADTMSAAIESFSPVPLDDGVAGLLPTVLRIPANVWANKNDFGNRIRNEAPYAKSDVPRASMGRPDTLEVFKLTAKGLNRVGGGDDLTPPPLSLFDVAPEDLEYLLGELTGGPGNLVVDMATSWQKATGGDYAQDLTPRDIPIAKRFRSNIDEQAAQQALFYERREVIDRSLKRVRMTFKAEGAEAAEALLRATPELKGAAFKRRKGRGRHGEPPGSIIVADGGPQIIAVDGDARMPPPSVYAAYKRAEKAIAGRNDAVDTAFTTAPASILPTARTRERDAAIRTENRIRQAAQAEFNAAWVRDVVGGAE